MNILYIDCSMGAAGDMLTAALLELHPDPEDFLSSLNALNIPDVSIIRETSVKCGITGTHIRVSVNGIEEDEHLHDHHHEHVHEHEHEHDHNHEHIHEHEHNNSDVDEETREHHHHHSSMSDIETIIAGLSVSDNVKNDILSVYKLIAEAESHVHGKDVNEIHFHEIGTMDAVADITAVCMLIHELSPDEIVVSPVHVGSGTVRCAHGVLPVPAPATAYLLKGVPIYGGNIKGELCTPTGAALLRHFATRFDSMPLMNVSAIGYGMGKKDFETANCVRAMLGTSVVLSRNDSSSESAIHGTNLASQENICELCFNVDDMTAEDISFACDMFFRAGAREVFSEPAVMKKSRMGTVIHILCNTDNCDNIISTIFCHTSTIGIRRYNVDRFTLDRRSDTYHTPYGDMRVKVSEGYGVTRRKYEHDDLERIALEHGLSIEQVKELLDEFI